MNHEDSEVGTLMLSASEEEHVAAVLAQEQLFCAGRVKNMVLKDYTVNILPMLRIHKDCEFESLVVAASKEEHITEMLSQDQKFCVGGVNGMVLEEYAVFVFLK
ncbi:MAG: uncharacterized protein A8A55_3444, partial [Amphiamblys sp. WSBS2006]